MPKYFCDYCDTYLTHDSPSVRKTHCAGRKHKENVKFYYQKWMEEQAQNLIGKSYSTLLYSTLLYSTLLYSTLLTLHFNLLDIQARENDFLFMIFVPFVASYTS